MAEAKNLRTPAGFDIQIRPDGIRCTVSKEGRLEIPQGGNKDGIQPVPGAAFVGKGFAPVVDGTVLVPNRSFKLYVPYSLDGSARRSMALPSQSYSDQLPAHVGVWPSVDSFLGSTAAEVNKWSHIIVDSSVDRLQMVSLKVKRPSAKILIMHGDEKQPEQPSEKVRATDIVSQSGSDGYSQNPVFMARLYLRQLDISRMKQMPLEFDLTQEDVQFIRTFLSIMIRNESNKPDLAKEKPALENLDEFFSLVYAIIGHDWQRVDDALEQGVRPEIAKMLVKYVQHAREKVGDKEDGIRLWEWEYRLNELLGA